MVKGNQKIETNYPAIDHVEIKEEEYNCLNIRCYDWTDGLTLNITVHRDEIKKLVSELIIYL